MPSSAMQLFGAYVRLHRKRHGLSKAALAARMNLPGPQTVAQIEAGRGVGLLDCYVTMDLARFCGLSLSQMLGETPPPEPRVRNRIHRHLGHGLHDLSVLPGLPAVHRETLGRIMEELGRVMRETMDPRTD